MKRRCTSGETPVYCTIEPLVNSISQHLLARVVADRADGGGIDALALHTAGRVTRVPVTRVGRSAIGPRQWRRTTVPNARSDQARRRPVSLGLEHRKRPRAGDRRPAWARRGGAALPAALPADSRGFAARARFPRGAFFALARAGLPRPASFPFFLPAALLRFRHVQLLSAAVVRRAGSVAMRPPVGALSARPRAPCWRGPCRALPDRGRCRPPTSPCSIPGRTPTRLNLSSSESVT